MPTSWPLQLFAFLGELRLKLALRPLVRKRVIKRVDLAMRERGGAEAELGLGREDK
jgi:hypothetical protein